MGQQTKTGCPSEQAVAAELERLGAAAALAELGSPEVTIEGTRMRVFFHGRDGSILGVREVIAPATCDERASIAAVFIAAWVGVWPVPLTKASPPETATSVPARTYAAPPGAGMAEPMDPGIQRERESPHDVNAPSPQDAGAPAEMPLSPTVPPPPPPASLPVAEPAPTRPLPARAEPPHLAAKSVTRVGQGRPRAEVAAWALETNDGNATTVGGGFLAGYRFARRIAVAALLEATGEREIAVGPGVAAYRPYRLGVGASILRTWGLLFLDGGIFPEWTMLTLRGGGQLHIGHKVTTWGAEIDLRVRLGLSVGRIAPFLFLGGSGALFPQKLTLDDDQRNTTLSRWSGSAGVGMAFLFGRHE